MFQCYKDELAEYINEYNAKNKNSLQIKLCNDQMVYTRSHELATWNKDISLIQLCDGINELINKVYLEFKTNNIFMNKRIRKNPKTNQINAYLQVDMKLLQTVKNPWNMCQATLKDEIVWNVLTKMTPYFNFVDGTLYEVSI